MENLKFYRMLCKEDGKKYGDEEARSKLNGIFNLPRYSSADFSPDHFNKIRQQLTDIILEYK